MARIVIRLKMFKRLYIDDGFLLLGWLCTLPICIIWQIEAGNMYFTAAQRLDVLPPPGFLPRLGRVVRAVYTTHWLLYSSLYFIKLSFLFFFRRLGGTLRKQKIIWWTVLVFTVLSYFASIGVIGFKCFLASDNKLIGKWSFLVVVLWNYANPGYTTAKCLAPNVRARHFFTIKFAAALDIVTDSMSECPPEFPCRCSSKLTSNLFASHLGANQYTLDGANQPSTEVGLGWHLLPHRVHHSRRNRSSRYGNV